MSVIERHGLNEQFRDATALQAINPSVEQGGIDRFLGRKRAGKSITTDLILRLSQSSAQTEQSPVQRGVRNVVF